jgi:hypothetical protein
MNSRCNYKNIFIVIGPFDGDSNLLCIYIFKKCALLISLSLIFVSIIFNLAQAHCVLDLTKQETNDLKPNN